MSLTKCDINSVIVIDAVHNRENLTERAVQIKKLFADEHPELDFNDLIENNPDTILELFDNRKRKLAAPIVHTIQIQRQK